MFSSIPPTNSLDAPDDILQQGYDEQFEPAAPDAYECPICLLVLRKPMQTECGHRFCRGCILKVVREGRPNCPIDNELLMEKQIYPDNFARREILNLTVRCHNHKRHDCPWLSALHELPKHLEDCEYSFIKCPNNCGKDIIRKKLGNHTENECVRRIVTCEYCDMKVIYQRRKDHFDTCLQYPVVCPNNCNTQLVRHQLDNHVESKCPKLILKCEFQEAGCPFTGTKTEMEEHMKDVSNSHMKTLIDCVITLKQKLTALESKAPKTPTRDVTDMKMDTTEEPVYTELIKSEIAANPIENDKLTKQMKELEIKVSQCGTVTEMCRSEIKQFRMETDDKLQKMQQTMTEQSNLIAEVSARMWCGKFVWRITDFDSFFKQAKNGELTALHSQPFYTGLPGYKMCLRVNLNGIDSGANTHVSMFVHLMQGEFDSIVDWPFPGGLTITIMDQDCGNDPHHVKETLFARPQLQAFLRPKAARNHKGYGYVEMIPHGTLKTRGYVKNNTMMVRVEVKMPQK